MIIIGLTGNIASGKSAVSRFLKKLGADIVDLDQLAKKIQSQNVNDIIDKMEEVFGKEVVSNGKVNRKKLGSIVFSDKEKLNKLNEIMIPVMTKFVKKIIEEKRASGVEVLVVDAAILFEANWDKIVDTVWVVYIPKKLQLERLMKRENIGRGEALRRIESQMPIFEKIKRTDVVIDNSGDFSQMESQILELWKKIQNSI
ncbi:MAG: dephospho-CoA kinase [Caldisericaceae bacterium]|nr:dephospho-CoA kinase [Caldisericaceae bacterium]RLD20744.1 MAG: dephospho-CoA kinase [Caldisericota bacterium]